MTRAISRWLLGTALAWVTYGALGDRPALALATYTSPFGDSPVVASVGAGTCASGPCQKVVWSGPFGLCATTVIGDGAGLTDTTRIVTGNGADFLYVGSSNQCNVSLGPLLYNGHILSLYGRGGDDLIQVDSGDAWSFGEDGSDLIFSFGAGHVLGGNGNDYLYALGSISTELIHGDAGNDCLEDGNAAALSVDCGSGTDTLVSSPRGAPASIHCENLKPGC